MKNTDRIGGLISLAITVFFWLSREEMTKWSAMFPNAVLWILGLLSVGLLVKSFVNPEKMALFVDGDRTRLLVAIAALFVWVIAMGPIGFFVSSLVVFSFLAWYLSPARVAPRVFGLWVVFIAIELGVFYTVFTKALYVPLPKGILF